MFRGTITALCTPFQNHKIDYASLEKLLEFQIENGVSGVVVNGTTGESPALTSDEFKEISKFVIDRCKKRISVLVGTGSNNTASTIEKTKLAKSLGADGALVVVPYYNKPPQEGLYQHFKAVAEAVALPIMLYNVPGRTVVSMSAETVGRLSQIKNIVGIKEASGDLKLFQEMKKSCRADFDFVSGDDGTTLEFCKLGGHGVISVVSNIIPKLTSKLIQESCDKKTLDAKEKQTFDLACQAVSIDTNPIPAKNALHLMRVFASAEMRLPLVGLDEQKAKMQKQKLLELGLL